MPDTVQAVEAAEQWFADALADSPRLRSVEVDGARISYRSWGEPGPRNILLVHGGAAHSGWWDHIAPLIADGSRVVALDLSGHGDSGFRQSYGIETWAAEAIAVARDASLGDSFTVMGHSLGGLITMHLLRMPGSPVRNAIVVDSPVGGPGTMTPVESGEFVSAARRPYASKEQLVARFRPVPAQTMLPWVADHVADLSVRAVDDGWTWKFDDGIFRGRGMHAIEFPALDPLLAFIRAEHGLVDPAARAAVLGAGAIFVELPAAGHAPMLDQPIALVTGIRSILAAWDARA